MSSLLRRAVSISFIFLLAACESPLQKLRAVNPSDDTYTNALASEFLAYADSESEQGRKLFAERYAAKGLKVLQGETVEPEPVDPKLPQENQQALTVAREQLMALMTDAMKQDSPQELARAQLLFDCWQHEIRKRINQELAPCEDEFKATLVDLQDRADELVYNEESKKTLTFAKDKTTLSKQDLAIITAIAAQVAPQQHYAIEVEAPETMGDEPRKLALARMAAVHKALARAGIAEKYIHVRKEPGDKKVYLSCDVSSGNVDIVTVTVQTPDDHQGEHL